MRSTMPIDFTKMVNRGTKPPDFLNNNSLHFKSDFSHKTSEIYPCKSADYEGLKINVIGNWSHISGSIHKMMNEGKHNYDDFTFSRLVQSIEEIEDLLKIRGENLILENCEFGVNINPIWDTQKITENLLCYGTNKFVDAVVPNGQHRVAIQNDFKVKAYDKGEQHKLPYNLFRFEVHCNKMRQLDKASITTLSDLTDKDKLVTLKHMLVEAWEKSLIFDFTIDDIGAINRVGEKAYYEIQHTKYWQGLNNKQRYKRKIWYYEKLLLPLSENVHKTIKNQINDKFDYLLEN